VTGAGESPPLCITGATGFVGSHLVAELVAHGMDEIRLMTRRGLPAAAASSGVTEIRGSLLDEEAARRFVVPGSVVVNLAYAADADAEANRVMADNLSRACRGAPAAHLIHCSTATVAGRPASDTVDESSECRPVTPYQESKLAIERLVLERLAGRCPVTIVRPTAVFGQGGRNLCGTIDELMHRPRAINLLRALVFGERRLHLIAVENVVAAIRFILAHRADLDREIFIVSDDDAAENNYRDVLDLVAEVLDARRFPRWQLPFGEAICGGVLRLAGRPDPNPRRVYSAGKLRRLGFQSPLELGAGVRRFTRWYARGGQGGA